MRSPLICGLWPATRRQPADHVLWVRWLPRRPLAPAPTETAQFRGILRDFQQRREPSIGNTDAELEAGHFRIERFDASGNRLAPVSVEMTSLTFRGGVTNGDEVNVAARPRRP